MSLSPQYIFDLSDLFPIAYGFYEIHENHVNKSLAKLKFVH